MNITATSAAAFLVVLVALTLHYLWWETRPRRAPLRNDWQSSGDERWGK